MSDAIRERVEKLNAMVLEGRIMEAMNEFYCSPQPVSES
jgi:hypothetical protein